MGHIGVKGLQSAVEGLPFNDSMQPSCEVCARANIKRSPFPKRASHRATELLERIHCDICGPLPNSYGNFQYYILFVDCHSRYISLFLMKNRSEALSLFIEFKNAAETFTGKRIKLLRVDNAPELIHGQMRSYCQSQGITYEKTVPDSPPQNGVAERTNLTICNMARAMLVDSNLRDYFWPFAVLTATHIKQRVPHSSLPNNTTPFEMWFHHRPNLSHLRPFGTLCTTRIISNHHTKFDPRGETGRFLGYASNSKGYLIWVPNIENNGGTVKVRRDVIFHEFPTTSPTPNIPAHYGSLWKSIDFPDRVTPNEIEPNPHHKANPSENSEGNIQTHPPSNENTNPIEKPKTSTNVEWDRDPPSHTNESPKSNRTKHPRHQTLPSKYADFIPSESIVEQLLALEDDEINIPLNDGPASADAIVSQILAADLALDNTINTATEDEPDPPTIRHAQRSKYWSEWLASMHEELEALKAKGVYEEISELPPGRKAVQCKWVFRIKRDQNGQISRFKGRLVAKGFTQIPGQDFTFTFAPVARWDSIRSVLCIATINNLELRHIDVKNAYLNGPLNEEIYLVAPEGSPAKYWRLHKGLYGLRQAGRQWYYLLHELYTKLGYSRCESDWSVYVRKTQNALTISANSVDDLLVASDSKTESNRATEEIERRFPITDGGDIEWLLGCRIRRWRDRRMLMIDQDQYTSRILKDFNMENCNSVKTPCPSYRLTTDMCPTTETERQTVAKLPFCAIVGKCMYLSTCTRPDISFAVRELARFMSNYGSKHYEAAKHLLRYLQGTRSLGIVYGNTPNPYPIFKCFTDSDWGMSQNRKSISGYVIECANGPISWSSKQQVVVALSSCEAEYLACSHCARQIIWLRSLFQELLFPQQNATPLYCDNQGTIACTHDPQSHSRMKHIDIRFHFIRDCVNNCFIDIHHIPGIENPADLFTKPLQRTIHIKWVSRLRIDVDPSNSS
jgi:hypothetical protein